jgi:hypothetical protein
MHTTVTHFACIGFFIFTSEKQNYLRINENANANFVAISIAVCGLRFFTRFGSQQRLFYLITGITRIDQSGHLITTDNVTLWHHMRVSGAVFICNACVIRCDKIKNRTYANLLEHVHC